MTTSMTPHLIMLTEELIKLKSEVTGIPLAQVSKETWEDVACIELALRLLERQYTRSSLQESSLTIAKTRQT